MTFESKVKSRWSRGWSRDRIANDLHSSRGRVQREIRVLRQDHGEAWLLHEIALKSKRHRKGDKGVTRINIDVDQPVTMDDETDPEIVGRAQMMRRLEKTYTFKISAKRNDARTLLKGIHKKYWHLNPRDVIRVRSVYR